MSNYCKGCVTTRRSVRARTPAPSTPSIGSFSNERRSALNRRMALILSHEEDDQAEKVDSRSARGTARVGIGPIGKGRADARAGVVQDGSAAARQPRTRRHRRDGGVVALFVLSPRTGNAETRRRRSARASELGNSRRNSWAENALRVEEAHFTDVPGTARVAQEHGCDAMFFNRDYEVNERARRAGGALLGDAFGARSTGRWGRAGRGADKLRAFYRCSPFADGGSVRGDGLPVAAGDRETAGYVGERARSGA